MPSDVKSQGNAAGTSLGGFFNTAGDSKRFTCFPKLPIELRIKIWTHACFVTRNIDIWPEFFPICRLYQDHHYGVESGAYYWHSSCANPAVLHANRESRIEGLKHYKLDFATNQILDQGSIRRGDKVPFTMSVSTPHQIYINWHRDRLCLINPYRLQPTFEALEDSAPFKDLMKKICNRRLRYFAINTLSDPEYRRALEGEENEDVMFTDYVPQNTMLDELVLFENKDWLRSRDVPKVTGLDFVDLKNGDDRRLDFVKKGLVEHIEKFRAKDILAFQTTPFIRICKAAFPE